MAETTQHLPLARINRRSALQAMLASVAAFVLPAPRRSIDLAEYCGDANRYSYDLHLPYVVNDWTYATDGHICVRTRPILADVFHHKGKVPPFEGIGWNHEQLRMPWRPLPRLSPMLAAHSHCPACDGYGNDLKKPAQECKRCGGTGQCWIGSNYVTTRPAQCKVCDGAGHIPPPGSRECSFCKGQAIGTFPGIVALDSRYFDSGLYEKARKLAGEFIHDNFRSAPNNPMLKIRFAEGEAVVLGLEPMVARRRLQERA